MERRERCSGTAARGGLEGLSLTNCDRVVDLDVLRLKFKNPEATAMKREAEEAWR